MGKFQDLTGKTFGRLTVIKRTENKDRRVMWECKCSCGNTTIVNSVSLTSGNTKSCGCLKHENKSLYTITHNLSNHKLYPVWSCMKARCYNTNNSKFKNYGARGIKVCDEWRDDFLTFFEWAIRNGWKDGLSIERIDVNGDYCPDNCTWIPMSEQVRNRTVSRWVTYNGKTKLMCDWAKELGITDDTLDYRIKNWGLEKALTTPILKTEKLLTHNGETHNIAEWSRITGIHKNTIEGRLARGWSIEDALTLQPEKRRLICRKED